MRLNEDSLYIIAKLFIFYLIPTIITFIILYQEKNAYYDDDLAHPWVFMTILSFSNILLVICLFILFIYLDNTVNNSNNVYSKFCLYFYIGLIIISIFGIFISYIWLLKMMIMDILYNNSMLKKYYDLYIVIISWLLYPFVIGFINMIISFITMLVERIKNCIEELV